MRWLSTAKRATQHAYRHWALLEVLTFVSLILILTIYQVASAGPPRSSPNPLGEPQSDLLGELLDGYPPDAITLLSFTARSQGESFPWQSAAFAGLAALIVVAIAAVVIRRRRD